MLSRENFILVFLFLILILLSVWQLPKSPATWFDEGINLWIAKSLINYGVFSLEIAPGEFVETRQFLITSNYPVLLPAALSMKIFGFNLLAARLPMVLFLFLFAFTAYFLVKKFYGNAVAIMSVALIVSFTPFYGNGKAVLGEIPGLFYFLTGLLLWNEWNDENKWKVFMAGLFFGLAIATKPFFLIVPVAILIGELFSLAPPWRGKLKRIAILSAVGVLPMIAWLYTILPSFSFAGLWSAISYYSNSYASNDFSSLIFANFLRFFTESTPIHFAVLFLVSAAFLIRRFKNGQNIKNVEIALAVFVLLTLAFYLKTPGWYRYFFPAHMILFLIFPAALTYFGGKKIAALAVISFFIFQLVFTINQRNTSLYYSDEAEVFSKHVTDITTPQDKILFINSPSAAFLTNDRQVYQYLQINPVLFFGKTDTESYSHIVLQGAAPDKFSEILKSYQIQKQVGHHALYRKRNF